MDPRDITNEDVLEALFGGLADDERAVLCSVPNDPGAAPVWAWGGIPWTNGTKARVGEKFNNYAAISTFHTDAEGVWRRRKDQFAALRAVMVDDVGTKVAKDKLPASLYPSLVVETSPGNYQVTYILQQPLRERWAAEDGIKQIIEKLIPGGVDPGMAGVTRVLRLPGGINGKRKYAHDGEPWHCRVVYWHPELRYTWRDIQAAFGLVSRTNTGSITLPLGPVAAERKRCFELVLRWMVQLHLKQKRGRGWIDITCPWVADHTDRADNGTALSYPSEANGWYGGFRCHHGHCEGRGWGHFETWVTNQIINNGLRTRGPFLGALNDQRD